MNIQKSLKTIFNTHEWIFCQNRIKLTLYLWPINYKNTFVINFEMFKIQKRHFSTFQWFTCNWALSDPCIIQANIFTCNKNKLSEKHFCLFQFIFLKIMVMELSAIQHKEFLFKNSMSVPSSQYLLKTSFRFNFLIFYASW